MRARWVARKYRHSLQYQEATNAPDAVGEEIKTWSTVATYRCEVRGLNGREALQVGQFTATLTSAVVHRFVDESDAARPKVGGRFLFGSRELYISAVSDPTGERDELKSIVTESAV
jgi:head-tail adaptor